MTDVRLDALVRTLTADTAAATREFAVGQQWTGHVVEALTDERFVIMLGSLRLLARSSLPLEAGQRLLVEVARTGDQVELRLRSAEPSQPRQATLQLLRGVENGASGADAARNYDIAAVVTALAARGGIDAPDFEAARAAATDLGRFASARSLPADAEALARLLQPLALDAAPDAAAALRDWLRNGGFLFEAHLRALLAATPPASADEALAALQADLKVLLGRLGAGAATRSSDRSETLPNDEGANRLAEVGRSPAAPAAVVSERALGEQVELAYRWLQEGLLTFEVPVRLGGGEARALVQFRRETDAAPAGAEAAPRCRVEVHVESEVLGPVQATASWRGGQCKAAFFVERTLARDCLAGAVESLKAGLAAVFEDVAVEVSADAVRARRPSTAVPLDPPPGGGIVSVRA